MIILTSADINLKHKRTPLVAPVPHEVGQRPEAKTSTRRNVCWSPVPRHLWRAARVDWGGW